MLTKRTVSNAVRECKNQAGVIDSANFPKNPNAHFTLGRVKVKQGKLTFILTRGIGQAFIADDVPADSVTAFLNERISG